MRSIGMLPDNSFPPQPEEAEAETIQMLRVYEEFATNVAAIPAIPGELRLLQTRAHTAIDDEARTWRLLLLLRGHMAIGFAVLCGAGRKSRIESFAGANCTYTIEAMMGDRSGAPHALSPFVRPSLRLV
jgi:hypothetical protein